MVAGREADRVRHPPARQADDGFADGRERKPRPDAGEHPAARKRLRNRVRFAHLLTRRETDRVRLAQERCGSDLHDEGDRRRPKASHPWQKGSLADKIDWSPNGARIAFSSPDPGGLSGVSSNVFTVRPDGTGLVKITNLRGGKAHNGLDSWSPDGRKIAFARIGAGKAQIYIMNANGSGIAQLTRGPDDHHASWGTDP
jgi:hypothetical protein